MFCYSEEMSGQDSYRAFNKKVTKERYYKILQEVEFILWENEAENLQDFYKSITQEQWKQLLAIPEAEDFKEGFEYISGCKINI